MKRLTLRRLETEMEKRQLQMRRDVVAEISYHIDRWEEERATRTLAEALTAKGTGGDDWSDRIATLLLAPADQALEDLDTLTLYQLTMMLRRIRQ